MKSGAADFDSVNEGLIQIYSSDGVHTAFILKLIENAKHFPISFSYAERNRGLIFANTEKSLQALFRLGIRHSSNGKKKESVSLKAKKPFQYGAVPEMFPILSLKKAKMMNLSIGRFATFSVMLRCMSRSILSKVSFKHSAPMVNPIGAFFMLVLKS